MTELRPHAFCQILRDDFASDADEVRALVSSISDNGPVRPGIIVDADDGVSVLDGWSFKTAWEQCARSHDGWAAKYPLEKFTVIKEFVSDDQKRLFVLGMQLGRRNLTPAQRVNVIQRLAATIGDLSEQSSVESIKKFTDHAMSKYAAVSGNMIALAKKIEQVGDTKLQQAVVAGKVSTRDAYEVAKSTSKGEQRELVEQGPEAVKAKAEEIREERRAARAEAAGEPNGQGATEQPTATQPAQAAKHGTPQGTSPGQGEAGSLDQHWRSAADREKRALVRAWRSEILAMIRADVTKEANGQPTFDKVAARRRMDDLRRATRNESLLAICQDLERALQFAP